MEENTHHVNKSSMLKLIFLGLFLFFVLMGFIAKIQSTLNQQIPVVLWSLGLVFFALYYYNFRSLSQVVILIVGWFLAIYGTVDIILGIPFRFPIFSWDIGALTLLYPSLVIFSLIVKDKIKDSKWSMSVIASLDTLLILGIILVTFAGFANIQRAELGVGITKDWREFYGYGIALMLSVAYVRDEYKIKMKPKFSFLVYPAIIISGLYLILEATFGFISSNFSIARTLIEALIGVVLLYTGYYFYTELQNNSEELKH